MGVFTRYKKDPDGFRKLVELWETSAKSKREKMIDAGMKEDPEYTQRILKYLYTFQDVLDLPDPELKELLAQSPGRIAGYAFFKCDKKTIAKVRKLADARVRADFQEVVETNPDHVSNSEIGGAQLKIIGILRKIERRGLIKRKRIPLTVE